MFPQTEGLEGDGGAEAQYAYYPATIAEATSGAMVTTVQASDTLLGQTTPTGKCCPCSPPSRGRGRRWSLVKVFIRMRLSPSGQVYVMMSPQEVLTGSNQRTIAPRTQPYIA